MSKQKKLLHASDIDWSGIKPYQPKPTPKVEEEPSFLQKAVDTFKKIDEEVTIPVQQKFEQAMGQMGSNPLAGSLNLLNAFGGAMAVPFMTLDKVARLNSVTEKIADVVSKPFEVAGQVGSAIMPTKEQLGMILAGHMIHLGDEALQETSEALDELGGMGAMFALGGGIGKGIKTLKGKPKVEPKIESKIEPKTEPKTESKEYDFKLKKEKTKPVEGLTQEKLPLDLTEKLTVKEGLEGTLSLEELAEKKVEPKSEQVKDVTPEVKPSGEGVVLKNPYLKEINLSQFTDKELTDKISTLGSISFKMSERDNRYPFVEEAQNLVDAEIKRRKSLKEPTQEAKIISEEIEKPTTETTTKVEKQAWEMTWEDYQNQKATELSQSKEQQNASFSFGRTRKNYKTNKLEFDYPDDRSNAHSYHRVIVEQALKEGKPVSPEVLKDYPDLIKAETPELKQRPSSFTKKEAKFQEPLKTPKGATTDRIAQLRKEALDEMNKTTVGINPILVQKSIQLGAEHFKAGLKTFTEWSKQMITDLGEKIKPHLLRIWDGVKKIISGEVPLFKQNELGVGAQIRNPKDILKELTSFKEEPTGIFKDITNKDFETISKEYETTIKNSESYVQRGKDAVDKIFTDANQGIKNTFESISTSAEKIAPEFFQSLRRYEQDLGKRDIISEKVLNNYLDAQKKAKLTLTERAQFEAGLDNPKFFDKAKEIAQKKGFSKELESILEYKDLLAEMLGVKLIKNHFPRTVKDYVGLRDELFKRFPEYKTVFEKMIADYEAKNGKMTYEQQMNYLNNALRGYNPKITGVTLSDLGNMKKRVIPVLDGELKKYYHTSNVSLARYLTEMDRLISEKKYFGKGGFSLEESIATLAKDLEKSGKIKGQDANEFKNILRARFNERGITNGVLRFLRDVGIVTKLHNPLAALTQVKDLSFSFALSPKNTTKVLMEKAFHKEMGFKLEELGYDPQHMAHELANVSGRQKFIQSGLKANAFFTLDMIGKEVRINTVLKKFQDWASKDINNPEFQRRLNRYFSGEEKAKVINDLKLKNKSDSVGFLLYNELSNMQPITLSELPKNYVAGGNNRIYYFLKTFSVRQLDFVLNETVRVMKDKSLPKAQRIEGGKNLLKLATSLILVGAGVDEVKRQLTDLITGRKSKVDFGDEVINNILNIVLLSRYDFTTFKQEGGESVAKQIAPPLDFPADEVLDTYNLIAGKNKAIKSLKQIPTIGRFLYEYTKKPKKQSKKFVW